MLENLKQVEWIKPFIQEELKSGEYETFKHIIMSKMESPKMPLHVLSLPAISFNLKQIEIDVSDFEQAINTSERVRQEIENMVSFKHVQN